MTIREKLISLLVERCVFEQDAKTIVQSVIDDPRFAKDGMAGRWDDSVAAYPQPIIIALWMRVKDAAIAHVEATCPDACYLPLLKGEVK